MKNKKLIIKILFMLMFIMYIFFGSTSLSIFAYENDSLSQEINNENEINLQTQNIDDIKDELYTNNSSVIGELNNLYNWYSEELLNNPNDVNETQIKLNKIQELINYYQISDNNLTEISTVEYDINGVPPVYHISPDCICDWTNYLLESPCHYCQRFYSVQTEVTVIIAGFSLRGWKLAADLMLHNMTNTVLDSYYTPSQELIERVSQCTQILDEVALSSKLTDGFEQKNPGRLNGLFANTIEGDVFNALGKFFYAKSYAGNGNVNISIQDYYDWERAGDSPGGVLVDILVTAQEIKVVTPFYTKIDITVPGVAPLSWEYYNNGVKITGIDKDISHLEIPTTFFDLRVKEESLPSVNVIAIGNSAFENCSNLTNVTIPDTVTNIDSSAFENCSYLQSVTLPANLVAIGSSAFKGCGSLASITIPNGVTHIDSSAFENCSYLQSVTFPTNLVAIGSSAFKGCGSLASITIPNGVTNIDSSAFENCSYLQSVTLSSNLNAIGVSAFKGCGSLGSITIPSNVQYIDDSAFENCSTLREVRVKKSKEAITHIGENAFDGCSSSLQIIVPKNRLAEYKNKVYWSSYKNKIIPDSAVFDELDLHCLVDNSNNVTLSAGYNKLYKLNVECNKSYKFTTSTGVELKVYDEYFDELYTGENTLYAYLSPGTYYLDVRYNSSATSGTITIDYELRWTHDGERVYYNDDHNLLTHLHETSDGTYLNKLYYINNNGAGLYKFQLNGSYSNNSPIVYDAGALTIYNESGRLETQLLNRYPNSSIMASSDDNQDTMYVYLPRNGYFYMNIVMPSESYGTLSLTISPVESETINLLSSMTSTFTEDLTSDNNQEEYAKKLIINQTSKYLITLNSSDALSNNFDIIMFKQTYSSSSNVYKTYFKPINYMTDTSTQKTFEVSLEAGVYFIYYYNNDTNANIDLTLTRILQNNSNRTYAMQADPAGPGYNPGSEVKFNKGIRNNYTITEGFTRNIYFVLEDFYTYSRLEFDWYSSNESIATVSEFGTVFAKNVSSTQTVTIYAVYKEDPSLIYYRTFNVVDDTSDEQIVITCNMSYSYSEENGEYQIELTDDNSPYPMIQYYDWSIFVPCQENDISVTMGAWGYITASGPGIAIITGTYELNPRVTIIINLSITE